MSIQEGTRDPQAGTSDAPPGREMQVRQGAQGSLVEEAVWSTAPLPTDILLRPTGPRRGERCIPHYKSHTFLKFAFPPCVSSLTSKCLAHHLSDGAQMENVTSSFSFTSNYSSGVERLPGLRANRPPLCPPPPEGVCLWVSTGKLKNQKDLHKC